MRSLTYVSSARSLWSVPELDRLLESARAWNEPRELTGMLLYSGGNFIQAVEGPEGRVAEVFERICADSRHRGLLVLLDEQVERRAFPAWTMGFQRFDAGAPDLVGHTRFLLDPAGAVGTGDRTAAQMILLDSFRATVR